MFIQEGHSRTVTERFPKGSKEFEFAVFVVEAAKGSLANGSSDPNPE